MIRNERQHRITMLEVQSFEDALASARERERSPGVDPRIHAAMIEALESELAILHEELERYETRVAAGSARQRAALLY